MNETQQPGRSVLKKIAEIAHRHYRRVFAVFGLLVVASIALATTLRFDTDMLRLLPKKDPAIAAYVDALEQFGTGSLLLVAVKIPEGAVLDPYLSYADALAAEVAKSPDIQRVEFKLGNPEELLTTFFPKAVLFLDDAGRQGLEAKLSDSAIADRAVELRRRLGTPQGAAMKELYKLDPLGLADVFLGRMESSRGALNVDWTSGYYLSKDHRLLLLLAEPKRPPQDVKFSQRMVASVRERIAAADASWPGIVGGGNGMSDSKTPPVPDTALGGPYLTTVGDATLIGFDMMVNIATSALGVLLLFLFAFRRPSALLYAFVPLLTGLILTFGFAKIAIGSLSSATSVVAALLIGLGIDFVIVNYGRFVEERRRGASFEAALGAMNSLSGRAVLTGAITTSATFYAFTTTDFIGLREMGLLTGTGILLCVISVLWLLPALLAWREDRHAKLATEPNLYIQSFGTSRLMAASMRHPRAALGLGVVVTLLAIWSARDVTFDESMKTMRPRGNPATATTDEIGKRFGSGFDSMSVILHGDTLEETLSLADRTSAVAQGLVERGVLNSASGVGSLIPPMDRQRRTLAWLAAGRSGPLDLARIRASFAAAAQKSGLRPESFESGFALLDQAISLSRPIGVDDFRNSRQTELLLDRFLARDGKGWVSAVYLFPPQNLWRREAPPDVVTAIAKLGPKATLTGVNVINHRVRTMVLSDAWVAGILGYLVVGLIVWIDFRSLRYAVLALVPLSIGIVWMVGGMAALGIQMNFINIFVTTMIIGIGVDYGVYVIHRYRETVNQPWAERERGMTETGGAVAVAALSTIVGFGSIGFSHYPGLKTVGFVAILGALSTCLITITLLPAYLSWRDK
ncbi:MAG TPA: MMPL family transporter [Thermoanaerobaculia bacterium]|jgi:predicted RND superfamily exporter protein|nr:MMPL family transporter [Thermoanaerobaculia bacterium]